MNAATLKMKMECLKRARGRLMTFDTVELKFPRRFDRRLEFKFLLSNKLSRWICKGPNLFTIFIAEVRSSIPPFASFCSLFSSFLSPFFSLDKRKLAGLKWSHSRVLEGWLHAFAEIER